jgi:hypothetical protein
MNSDKAQRLRELLCRELNIPPKAFWFEVRFAVDELITVKCGYFPNVQDTDSPAPSAGPDMAGGG